MSIFFSGLFDCVKRKKGYFVFLILLSLVAIVLGIVAAVNFGGGIFDVDLSKIAYIKFLKGDCGFMSMMFGLILSLFIFLVVCLICHWKSWLLPLGILFYLYLVYSQSIIFMSIILIYGFFNCVILAILLLVYSVVIWAMFLLLLCELLCFTNSNDYFKCCCSFKKSRVLWFLIGLIIVTLIFSLILSILKSYVILLIY